MSFGILGANVLVAPTDGPSGYVLIKPNELDLDAQGEVAPGCEGTDSEGIALCKIFQPLVMFVGGARDPENGNVLRDIFTPYNNSYEGDQDIGYGAFQTKSAIKSLALHWMARNQKVVLVGHSYGGDTVMDTARELSAMEKKLELVVTLDPVSRGGPRADQPKPKGVKTWLNISVDYQRYRDDKRLSNAAANKVALTGGVWGHCRNADENQVFFNGTGYEHALAADMFAPYKPAVRSVV